MKRFFIRHYTNILSTGNRHFWIREIPFQKSDSHLAEKSVSKNHFIALNLGFPELFYGDAVRTLGYVISLVVSQNSL